MPVRWSCDACGRQMTSLSTVFRTYRVVDYKNLCGSCSGRMDDAALAVFRAIVEEGKIKTRTPLQVLRQWMG